MRTPMRNQSIYNVTSRIFCRTICSILAVLTFLALCSPAYGQSAKDPAARTQAAALFAKALAVSDIRAPGSPPFQMSGTINLKDSRGKTATGAYLLKWAAPDQWREEIHFGNYARIRVGGKNQYWQSRTTPYELQSLLQLSQGLNFLQELHVWSNPANIAGLESVDLHQKKDHGTKLSCVMLKLNEMSASSDYCFDPLTGTLAIDRLGSVEFSGFLSFGGKRFPGNMRAEAPPAVPITLQLNSIMPLVKADQADFQPPPGSTVWPFCDAPDSLPTLKSRALPEYPMGERMEHEQGSVFIYAVIGTNGRLSNLKLLSAPDAGLGESALSTVGQWRYKPETCGGQPVPIETSIRVVYALGE